MSPEAGHYTEFLFSVKSEEIYRSRRCKNGFSSPQFP